MVVHAVAAASQPFAEIALLAGAVVGALLRVVLQRVLRTPAQPRTVWLTELGVGLLFGIILGVPFIATLQTSAWVGSSLGGALTAYSGASGAIGFLVARSDRRNSVLAAAGHFLACIAATTFGFVIVVLLWRAVSV
jgi:fluoride ion exporter CrcB/FEX